MGKRLNWSFYKPLLRGPGKCHAFAPLTAYSRAATLAWGESDLAGSDHGANPCRTKGLRVRKPQCAVVVGICTAQTR
jgi:hypothetical protein